VIGRALGRLGAQSDTIAEVEQLLRERFLVGTRGRPPAAGTYAGYGSLAAWVRVSALREYYGLAREGRRWQQLEETELAEAPDGPTPGSGTGAELEFLKEQYRPQFKAALAEALTCLDARERNVLRHHYLDGLQVGQIGLLYRVHRVTASRWLASARKAVLSHTRRLLTAQLDISTEEFESIVRLVQSQLDLSIRTHLRLLD
jgi:RNA polymerase sigma-70 factor, ECF subfamily